MIKADGVSKIYTSKIHKPGISGYVKNIFSSEYSKKIAVDNVSFEIEKGTICGYVGPNGSGKSTTIKMLCGVLNPDCGEIFFNDEKVSINNKKFKKEIGVVFGHRSNLWNDLPTLESINLFKAIYEINETEFKRNFEFINSYLEISGLLNTSVRKLSLGQRVKCDIAVAMLHFPDCLFLDEPTIGLDSDVRQNVIKMLTEYNKAYNKTIIITSHNFYDIEDLCKRIMIINKGKLIVNDDIGVIKSKHIKFRILSLKFKSKEETSSSIRYISDNYNDLDLYSVNDFEIGIKFKIEDIKLTNQIINQFINNPLLESFEVKNESLESIIQNITKGEILLD